MDNDRDRIILPRLGGHLRIWGSGHWCDSDEPDTAAHRCICICGIEAPADAPHDPEANPDGCC